MKVAVCFSGQLRTCLKALENQRLFFGDMDIDFFVHTWTTNTNRRYALTEVNEEVVPSTIISRYVEQLKPKVFHAESAKALNMHGSMNAPIALYYSWMKSVEFRRQYEASNNIQYDAVVKMRPDIIFPRYKLLSTMVEQALNENAFIMENGEWRPPEVMVMDDVFWVAPTKIMDTASEYFWALKDNLNNPTLGLGKFLMERGINVGVAAVGMYSILRPETQHLDPIADFEKCFELEHKIYTPPPSPDQRGSPRYYGRDT